MEKVKEPTPKQETGINVEDIKKLNLYEKLLLITNEVGVIEKNLSVQVNKNNSYKAVSERDVLDAVKPIEQKYRVYSYPYSREIIDYGTLQKETEFDGKISRTNTLYMRVQITYRFVNIDNPEEFIDVVSYGDGLDTGDKAPGKAMTYADKYALLKAYKLSTGDDPDKDPSPENGYSKTTTKKITKATARQVEVLSKVYVGDNLTKLLQANNIEKLEDLSVTKASELIKKLNERNEAKENE